MSKLFCKFKFVIIKKKGLFIIFNGKIFELLYFRGGGIKCEFAYINLVNFV